MTLGSGLAKTGSTVRFQLKTLSREAVLLYSSGPPAKPDFAAVELVEGHLRISLDSSQSGGGGAVDLFSEQAVDDGLWHSVSGLILIRVLIDFVTIERHCTRWKFTWQPARWNCLLTANGQVAVHLAAAILFGWIQRERRLSCLAVNLLPHRPNI